MNEVSPPWQILSVQPPADFVVAVQQLLPETKGTFAAQLLWQRGIRAFEQLPGFLDPACYQPTSPFAFGAEMEQAVERLQTARDLGEQVAIWGDFDADGVTATAVLWEGLGQFFPQQQISYFIPNRLTESHGLSIAGIDRLHQTGCNLIVTCDTGSTNLAEIDHANRLGIDVIVTDHHTLPSDRPPVVAILNPRSLSADHPLAHLSGVAVAYKLVEAMYAVLSDVPQKPLESLLDLVAIGLIADLVELRGDCRYLAQVGIQQLQKQSDPATATRPGVAKLLEYCKRTGDRPTDISFGLGPRINAVSRIQGDAHFCIELLTSQDEALCQHLAEATELANTRRKALQKDVMQQVKARVAQLDLSTTQVVVLADEQWQVGVLGLVAGQIAQEYGRPTILLSLEGDTARGSARSAHNIDLYQLVKDQAHLLTKFGGHPYAAGLALPIANLDLFTDAINQQLRQAPEITALGLQVDLTVTVADLGKALFQELKALEPYGIGNPVPRLQVKECWFETVRNQRLRDRKGSRVEYIKTTFDLRDESTQMKFPGVWWGHYRDEVPTERCDALVELDFNAFQRWYEVRLIAVSTPQQSLNQATAASDWLLDWRGDALAFATTDEDVLMVPYCLSSWAELQAWARRSQQEQKKLAIAYAAPLLTPPAEIWTQLLGIAKYLDRTGKSVTRQQMLEKLGVSDRTLQFGFRALTLMGFQLSYAENALQIGWQATSSSDSELLKAIDQLYNAIKEEQFHRQYFYRVPLETIRAMAERAIA
ncbi:MAG TPA: single-stranded-DNA-specific exonuclease RecJ [Leptolyngbyaceae cyanobacterium M33_DOE_097]|uniref:Single-stranded-DNA-specific exonuclease RecJ n=1 Tax=Oscillatoriales cyanobacterium SpSt-418 TaxID=2282169 RepID=A0A7C3KHR2_9CYAN|nr:single-stranded-DNA-specific exonuclease RecJ [Leptolyngbyaceae cyanobacterium M33_DOE_097]